MNLGLEGRTALVTGGGAGIGAAAALALAREGCDVAIVDRHCNGTADAVRGLGRRACAAEVDVRDHAAAARVFDDLVASWGGLDLLVCCAGITADAVMWKMTEAQWDEVIAVNLKGAYNYNQLAAGHMKDRRRGRIVNVASINGLRGKFGQANYAASKAGVIAMSKSLARELGKFNVNVNVIAPGMVETDMIRSLSREVVETAIDESLLGRLAAPQDCADLVVFLCSDRARHITGEVIRIDGGQSL
jgi:3-oxoacyl-[acyl-carrier protein] reductase